MTVLITRFTFLCVRIYHKGLFREYTDVSSASSNKSAWLQPALDCIQVTEGKNRLWVCAIVAVTNSQLLCISSGLDMTH